MTAQQQPRRRRAQKGSESPTAAPGSLRRRKTTTDSAPTATNALLVVLGSMTEAAFQRTVKAFLTKRGYTVWVFPIMKRTMAGVPDLTFWHPSRPGRLWAWELKRQTGRVRPEQAVALAHLATVPGIDARIVRPADWPALRDELDQEV